MAGGRTKNLRRGCPDGAAATGVRRSIFPEVRGITGRPAGGLRIPGRRIRLQPTSVSSWRRAGGTRIRGTHNPATPTINGAQAAEEQAINTESNGNKPLGFYRLYDLFILRMPWLIVIASVALTVLLSVHIPKFKMDASSDSIVLENDRDLLYYDETRRMFGSDDYVFIAVTPRESLFADSTIDQIHKMTEELGKLESVTQVLSYLTVPLFHSPQIPLLRIAQGYNTMLKPGTDRELAREELTESPLYQDYLISEDAKTTTIQVTFAENIELNDLFQERQELRDLRRAGQLSVDKAARLKEVERIYKIKNLESKEARAKDIDYIREVMSRYQSIGDLHLGGVPMIVADIIAYVRRDVFVFGAAVLGFTALMMALIFRSVALMMLPFLTCLISLLIMMGYMGYVDWRTTIVTSNFSSLLLIITTENAIHLGSHWRDLSLAYPDRPNRVNVLESLKTVLKPCFLSTFTTVVGFASLVVSDIRPVMDFGILMTAGLIAGFVVCFVFMPAALLLMPKVKAPKVDHLSKETPSYVSVFARFTDKNRLVVVLLALALMGLGASGISRLTVENRFIDYFKEDTPIYTGMTVIDERLGGTTPLEVVIEGEKDPATGEPIKDYWIDPVNLAKLTEIHNWLDELPETGKVLSLSTMLRIIEKINNGKPLPKSMLVLARNMLPGELRDAVLKPYVNEDFTQVRISMRVRESSHDLQRKALLAKIDEYMQSQSPIPAERIHTTGMFVLYDNMLQSLFSSQVKTVSTVLLVVFLTFCFLFRNWKLALIGLVPNVLSVTLILGLIGWLGIPMDMMTVMIAAITFGLADDNTIHYIHRFRTEFPRIRNYRLTMYRCHDTIGRPLSYSMITIVGGFAILTMSSFIPTIYFGIFTGLAVFMALLWSHTILPLLIIWIEPLGPNAEAPVEGVAPEASAVASGAAH